MNCAAFVQLTLFGTLAASLVDAAGRAKVIALADRPGSLLAYLALARGKLFSRGELMTALWGDRGEAAGTGAFNTTLWRLRKTIERPPLRPGDLIASDLRGTVGLSATGPLQLDVDEFERLVAPALAKSLAATSDADVEGLRRGVALYLGDVLAGFSDDWALRLREKHRRQQLNALGRLVQISALARDAAGGIRHAQAILDLDALREDVHRELMRFYLLAGQRALALRQFEICRAALKRELAIQPMHDTVTLYQRIVESALGHVAEADGDTAWRMAATAASDVPRRRAGDLRWGDAPRPVAAEHPTLLPAELIASARRHLAAADAELQLALPLFDTSVDPVR